MKTRLEQKIKLLEFKHTVSKGRDTYGYNICSLYVDGKKITSCNGGGYDLRGATLGNWIEKEYKNRLLKLKATATNFYGLSFVRGNPSIQGECGFDSVEKIINAIGLQLKYIPYKNDCYILINRR